MRRRPRMGLLPFYLKLYDEASPDLRGKAAPLIGKVAEALTKRGVDVKVAPICCVEAEFRQAVDDLKSADVDLLGTLHLAYSPSLESAAALAESGLPICVMDTTPDFEFGRDVDPEKIGLNHGVHGVMDLTCMLIRLGKPFRIVSGHYEESDVLDRAAGVARAALAARRLRSARVLRVGEAFRGMGDFSVDEAVLRETIGPTVAQIGLEDLADAAAGVTPEQIAEEMASDRAAFDCQAPEDVHERSTRVGLGLRRLLDEGAFGAFTVNFLAFDRAEGPASTVPFLEASKAMARGCGYAGEGDALTAALVGALNQGLGATTFTEIFCPDWKGGTLFLSHMGEINPEVSADKPRLVEKPFPFAPARNPAVLACAPRPGPAVYVNLAPGPEDTFTLIAAPVECLGDATHEEMLTKVRGWVRPPCNLEDFLEEYSLLGGTHHSALVMTDDLESIAAFAEFAGLDLAVIEA